MMQSDDAVLRSELSFPASRERSQFAYDEAFSRNLGWLTDWEQYALRNKRVAIAGMGGVGGYHLLSLARTGIGAFNIADPDTFELANFNRQVGATMDTLGRPKVDVLAEQALAINPELRIARLNALDEKNLDQFLAGADLCVDGLDFFAFDIRHKMTDRCGELGIPVINAAPLGMGTAFLIFMPGGMKFEDWFRLSGLPVEGKAVSYLLGMAPSALHRPYLADPSRVDLRGGRGPSTVAACELCAGVSTVAAIKLLLGRGSVKPVPYYHQFDAYRGRYVVKKLRAGNANPLQRLKIAVTRRLAARLARDAAPPRPPARPLSELEQILDLARWAPSGDNGQPWRFEIMGENRVVVHLTDQAGDDIYDYRNGEPTLISAGMLLESVRLSGAARGRRVEWHYEGRTGHHHRLSLALPPRTDTSAAMGSDPLVACLPLRSVDRRLYRLRPLTTEMKTALAEALGEACHLEFHENFRARLRLARLCGMATKIRVTTPEAFAVHRRVLDWQRDLSPTGIPAKAAGLHYPSRILMRWGLQSWSRMRILNRLGAPFLAAVEMDYLPGLFSAGYFTVRMKANTHAGAAHPISVIEAGMAIQRLWLRATQLGLSVQPVMAPLIFAHYGQYEPSFTAETSVRNKAAVLGAALGEALDAGADLVFMGRIGSRQNRPKLRRSTRLPLRDLLIDQELARTRSVA